MANIPLPKMPDVKSATGFSQVDPNTGNQANRALQGLGGAIAEAGKTVGAFAKKKQKVMNDHAEAEQDIAILQAKGIIRKFAAENQNDPDAIKSFSQDTMSSVLDEPTYMKAAAKADEGKQSELLDKFRYQSEKNRLETENETTIIEVKNANASQYNLAQSYRRAGMPQEAFDSLQKMSVSDAQLHDNMENVFSEGVSFEVGSRIQSAYNSTDISRLEALKEELEAKNDGGRFSAYEYTVKYKGKDIPAGGLSIGARKQSIEEINSKISRLEVAGVRGQRKAIKSYYKDDIMVLDPNLPTDVREPLEDIRLTDTGTAGMASGEFTAIQMEIVNEQSTYLSSEGYVGMKEASRKKIWKSIENGGFSEAAQMSLVRRMLAVEELRAGRDESRGVGMQGFFVDPDIPAYKQKAQQVMVSRYTRQADLIIEGLGEGRNSDAFLGFSDAMDELEGDLENLSEKDAEKYIKQELPLLWNKYMANSTQEALDNLLYK
jgi:hypothetical protein